MSNSSSQHTYVTDVNNYSVIRFSGVCTGIYKQFTLTWSRSFTLSMGATAVLEMAAAIPPAKKSLAKEIACSLIFSCYQPPSSYSVGGVEMAESYLEVRGFKEAVREKKRELRFFSAIGRL